MRISKTLLLTAITALLTLTCEKVPDYCGTGELYDPSCEFCFGSRAYPTCSNGQYNPLTGGCDRDRRVGTRCSDASVVPLNTPCGGYTLTTAATPSNRGSVDNPAGKTIFDEGDPVTLTAVAEDADYEFAGWTGAVTSTSPRVTHVMTGSKPQVTIVAMFRPKGEDGAYTLLATEYPEGAGNIARSREPDIDGEKYSRGTRVTVTADAKDGYVFDGWSGSESSRDRVITLTMEETKTVVAMFIPAVQTLVANVTPADGGTVFINSQAVSGNISYDEGKTVQLWAKANEADGYGFVSWTGAAAGQPNPATITVKKGGMTITANFGKGAAGVPSGPPPSLNYTLTVNKNYEEGGTVWVNNVNYTGPVTVGNGQEVNIKATANAEAGYLFTGWIGAGVPETERRKETISVTMFGDVELTANFGKDGGPITPIPTEYAVTVSNGTGGRNYAVGATVTITAEDPPSGQTFSKWTTSSNGVNFADPNNTMTTFIMPPNNVTVAANFEKIPPLIPPLITPLYGTPLYDERDNQTYSTVIIGSQTWMAKNLNYKPEAGMGNSWCYGEEPSANGVNLVKNGDFANGLNDWTLLNEGGQDWNNSRATANVSNNAVTIDIETLQNNGNTWDVQLVQVGLPLLKGSKYILSFSAVAQSSRTMWVICQKATDPWDTYFEAEVNLTTAWKTFSYEFEMAMGNDDATQIAFNLGRSTTGVTISKVSVTSEGSTISSDNGKSNCETYGRLYDYNTAKTVCPSGWHLPSSAEWDALATTVGDSSVAGKKLKSTSGWNYDGNGTDEYGFSALPGGYHNSDDLYSNVGYTGCWWTATEYDGSYAYYRYILYLKSINSLSEDNDGNKSNRLSVRCVSD